MAPPEPMSALAERLLQAQLRLSARPREQICAALEEVTESWLKRDSPWLARAVPVVAAEGGFSAAMVRHALPSMIAPLAGTELRTLAAQADAARRESRPRLTLQILPSNVPGLAAIASALALLCRSATLLKPGRRDRAFPQLWVESLASVDSALAECIAVAYRPEDAHGGTDTAFAAVDLVVATGSDDAIAALRAKGSKPIAAYGSRLSVALVAAEACATADDLRDAARAVAQDVAVWDQRGCLSPRLCFVEGDRADARRFAAAVAAALHELAVHLPPGPMTTDEILAVRRFRDAAEWSAPDPTSDSFFAVEPGAGSVAVDDGEPVQPAPTHRCLRVVPVVSSQAMLRRLHPWRSVLEGVGVAAPQHYPDLARELETFGFPLVARAGTLQRPPLLWRHGGRSRIAPWTEPG